MQQKNSSKRDKFRTFLQIANNTRSWLPVNRNGWWIKFSTYHSHNILIFFVSQHTGQTIVRYFDNEDDAVKYINYICDLDPTVELEV
jgi:hypothetical protein